MARQLGPTAQKILLLALGGVALGLANSPQRYNKILKELHKSWKDINRRDLQKTINNLYKSKLISMKENENNIEMILTEKGKNKVLLYNFEQMYIAKPKTWDRKWRLIIFDIPENLKRARNALREKLENLGFLKYQKSVFVYPYECKDEIDFIIEFFNLRPFVRYIEAIGLDNELDVKKQFKLL